MSLVSRAIDIFRGTTAMDLPRIAALGNDWAGVTFSGFDDPNMIAFMQEGRTSASGVCVNERKVMRNSAFNRAVTLISSSLGMLPLQLFQWVDVTTTTKDETTGEETTQTEKAAVKAKDHPAYRLLAKKPNSFQTPMEFKSYMVSRAIIDGIAYAVKRYKIDAKVKGGRRIDQLVPLDPKKVQPRMTATFDLVFDYNGSTIPAQDMFWFRGPTPSADGVTGLALLDVAVEAIGLAHASEIASGNVLKNGALVGGVLEHPKALSQPAIERLRTQFEERQSSSANSGKWIVAEDGLQVKPFGHTLQEAQNIEQREFGIAEAGRFTGVPRPLLFMDETSWGSGIEQLGLFFITYCLLSWFVTIEEAITRSLLSEEESDQYFAKFNDGALLRGSLESQANFFFKALGAGGGRGWMTQNEVRDKFNQAAKDGGDELPNPVKGATGATDPAADPAKPADGTGGTGKKPARSGGQGK